MKTQEITMRIHLSKRIKKLMIVKNQNKKKIMATQFVNSKV